MRLSAPPLTPTEEQLLQQLTELEQIERVGKKADTGKPRWHLLPYAAIEEVVYVLTAGAEKYDDDNWRHVPQAKDRYFSAAMRHLVAWKLGEERDPETELSHLAHAVCCLLFLLTKDLGK